MTREELEAKITETFDPVNIARQMHECVRLEDAVTFLKLYGEYCAVRAKSEGLREGLDCALGAVDKALAQKPETFPDSAVLG